MEGEHMLNLAQFKDLINPLSWISNLGKEDTKNYKEELQDLLMHSTQSLRTVLEITKVLDLLDLNKLDESKFKELYYNLRGIYTGNHLSDQIRTHCTNIERDVRRLNFKASILLRSEIEDYKDVRKTFFRLIDADGIFITQIDKIVDNVSAYLESSYQLIEKGDLSKAKENLSEIKNILRQELVGIEDVLKELKKAENSIRNSLT
jgi:hypothetical protein